MNCKNIKDLNLNYSEFPEEYYQVSEKYISDELDFLIKIGNIQLVQPTRILMMGTGDSYSAKLIYEHLSKRFDVAITMIAIDISMENLKAGNDGGELILLCGDWDDLPLKSGKLDLIFFDRSLHHVVDLNKSSKTFYPLLKLGGKLIAFREPTAPYLFSYFSKRRFGKEERLMGHVENIYTLFGWHSRLRIFPVVKFYPQREYYEWIKYSCETLEKVCPQYLEFPSKVPNLIIFRLFYKLEYLMNKKLIDLGKRWPKLVEIFLYYKNAILGYRVIANPVFTIVCSKPDK